jgi:hypothetical protein
VQEEENWEASTELQCKRSSPERVYREREREREKDNRLVAKLKKLER